MAEFTNRKEQLIARRAELDDRLHNIDDELESHHTRDIEDHATEVETDEVLESMGNAGLVEIRMIDAALDRIEQGTYGNCVRCWGEISQKRLDVLPYTPICKTCAAMAERS